jgi:hypothetical protein
MLRSLLEMKLSSNSVNHLGNCKLNQTNVNNLIRPTVHGDIGSGSGSRAVDNAAQRMAMRGRPG